MAAAYDSYDYPSYWQGREYEHASEVIALKSFLAKIPKINNLIDIGAGYGRLTPTYLVRSKKITLIDPSARLLQVARRNFKKNKKIRYIHSKAESMEGKVRNKSSDVVIMIRVLHHIEDIDRIFKTVNRILQNNGHFILEFANKSHFKSSLKEVLKGNIMFPLDIFPKDIRSKKSIRLKCLPFINYHPGIIKHKLEDFGFSIVEVRSVSNIRYPFLKRILPQDFILSIEKTVQTLLSKFDFGPSIFVLAKKITL